MWQPTVRSCPLEGQFCFLFLHVSAPSRVADVIRPYKTVINSSGPNAMITKDVKGVVAYKMENVTYNEK